MNSHIFKSNVLLITQTIIEDISTSLNKIVQDCVSQQVQVSDLLILDADQDLQKFMNSKTEKSIFKFNESPCANSNLTKKNSDPKNLFKHISYLD